MEPSSLKFSVGLEIHARLKTQHKIFCSCPNRYGDPPNTNICPVCQGLPGSLPVFNQGVVPLALRAAVALNCHIQEMSEFSRKNYFYPDLPRNFQITQYEHPLALGGYLENEDLRVNFQRIHLEEDAGRSLDDRTGSISVDLNRAGTPLIEIVTEPDFETGDQARDWLSRLRQLLRHLDVCDGKMERGSLRCDANVGIAAGHELAGPWVELKNLNSFKAVGQAVDVELARLKRKISNGDLLQRETRAWDPNSRKTTLLRVKEDAAQYRYFPEPDLPVLLRNSVTVSKIQAELPELPMAQEKRFQNLLGISHGDAVTFCRSRHLAEYFESSARFLVAKSGIDLFEAGNVASNWVLAHVLNSVEGQDERLPDLKLDPEKLGEVLANLQAGKIHRTRARLIVDFVLTHQSGEDILDLIQKFGQLDERDSNILESLCSEVLIDNPQQAEAFRKGKQGLINYLVGQVIIRSEGVLDAETVRITLLKMLI